VVLQNGIVVLYRGVQQVMSSSDDDVSTDTANTSNANLLEAADATVEAVVLAKEVVVPQRVLVAGDELLLAGGAAKAIEMKDLVLGAHHIVVLAKTPKAFVALGAKQPVDRSRDAAVKLA
jgi:shikimate 5-dehydrogenase